MVTKNTCKQEHFNKMSPLLTASQRNNFLYWTHAMCNQIPNCQMKMLNENKPVKNFLLEPKPTYTNVEIWGIELRK